MPLTLSGTTGVSGVDGTAATPAVQGSDTNTGVFYGTDTVSISTGGTARVVVNSDGQTVLGAGTASLPALSTTGDLNTGTFYPAADTIGWTTGGSERARIDSSGNIRIGTTTGSGGQLTLQGNARVAFDLRTTSTDDVLFVVANTGGSAATAVYVMPIRTGSTSTFRGGIQWDGANLLYNNVSDVRLKNNIADAPSALQSVLSIQIRQFNWKETGRHTDYGFIAQEVQQHAPEIVSEGEIWAVDYGRITPRLIKAIQELSAKLDAAEARIAALEAK